MKKKTTHTKKLNISRETLSTLDPGVLHAPAAGSGCPEESHIICSEVHTCVSCAVTTVEA